MSAEPALDELVLDVSDNSATASLTLDVGQIFDENGELRLWEDDDGWSGYALEDGCFYHVNTWRDRDDPFRKYRVGKSAVRDAIVDHINDPDAGGGGRFVRGADPTGEDVATDGGYDYDLDEPGVPKGDGESFAELAERVRSENLDVVIRLIEVSEELTVLSDEIGDETGSQIVVSNICGQLSSLVLDMAHELETNGGL